MPLDQELDSPEPKEGMPLLKHLDQMRSTVLYCLAALLAGSLAMALFLPFIATFLKWPLVWAGGSEVQLYTTSIMGVFVVALKVCLLGGLGVSLPLMLYFIARFIAPGLTARELALLRPACCFVFILFVVGAVFSFFVLVPASIRAALFLNEQLGYTEIWTADRYYGLLTWMVFGVGLVFELPLIIILLVYAGLVTHGQLVRFRPYSVLVFLGLAAVITPTTDPFTFILLAAPMALLYEIALRVARGIERHAKVLET